MTVLIGITAEAEADADLLGRAVDERLIQIEYIDASVLDGYRRWVGLNGRRWQKIGQSWDLARERGLPIRGHFDGRAGEDEASMYRAAFLLFADSPAPPSALVVARDIDRRDRLAGFEQAVQAGNWPFRIVSALAQPEIEAWKVAAWHPDDQSDTSRHQKLVQELSFDPVTHAERLTSTVTAGPRDAKAVCDALYDGAPFDVTAWQADPRPDHWEACGLSGFLDEVDRKIVPLF